MHFNNMVVAGVQLAHRYSLIGRKGLNIRECVLISIFLAPWFDLVLDSMVSFIITTRTRIFYLLLTGTRVLRRDERYLTGYDAW